jgi:paraquat-inducible protein B
MMAIRANPKLIGAFVVGGVFLFVVMIIAFGSFKFFAARIPVVMYFEGDMSGLDIGAAVNFRGVRIGSVTKVLLEVNVKDMSARIPVYAELDPEEWKVVGGPRVSIFHRQEERLKLLLERGLRARLASQSLVTGKLVVELSFQPDTPVRLVGVAPDFIEVPTLPSEFAELKKSVADVLDMIGSAKIPELVADLRQLIQDVNKQVKAGDPAAVMIDAQELMKSVQRDVDRVAASFVQIADTADPTLKSADRLFQDADRTVVAARPLIDDLRGTAKRLDELISASKETIEPGSPLQREAINALKEIASVSRSVRVLADDLEKNPDSILFGKAVAKR